MSLLSAVATRNALLTTAGKNALNVRYPKEFELYLIALELTDESYNTLRYFVFPVNPSSLEESIPKLTNVKKTLAGVTVLKTPTFVPTDITISGNFGRNFKVLLGGTYQDFISSFVNPTLGGLPTRKSIGKGVAQIFDDRIKTGYGCIKILEDIINESSAIVDGQQRKLIFHNPALGNSYLVEPMSLKFNQNEQSNMIWNYSLQLKSIAPLENIMEQKDISKGSQQLNITGYTQKKVNDFLKVASSLVEKGYNAVPRIGG